jgi:hypothetical protein
MRAGFPPPFDSRDVGQFKVPRSVYYRRLTTYCSTVGAQRCVWEPSLGPEPAFGCFFFVYPYSHSAAYVDYDGVLFYPSPGHCPPRPRSVHRWLVVAPLALCSGLPKIVYSVQSPPYSSQARPPPISFPLRSPPAPRAPTRTPGLGLFHSSIQTHPSSHVRSRWGVQDRLAAPLNCEEVSDSEPSAVPSPATLPLTGFSAGPSSGSSS